MQEINNIKKKFNVISTFSGGGGSCLGYKMAGGKILVCNEFVSEAVKTYKKNFKETVVIEKDIRKITGKEMLESAGLKRFELDIFDGSPPCAAFSTAGKRSSGWGKVKQYSDKKQIVDDLFFEYIRLLDEIKPKMFIAENVKGLTMGKAKGYLKEIFNLMKTSGYNVKCKVLNSYNYGVPQSRERLIFVGVRNDIEKEFFFPQPCRERYTIKDLFPYIHSTKMGGKPNNWSKTTNRPAGTITQHIPGLSGYMSEAWVRENDLKPRTYTIDELKKLQSLPSDYIVTGTKKQQWERIGRMVPPLMMKHIACAAYEGVIKNV